MRNRSRSQLLWGRKVEEGMRRASGVRLVVVAAVLFGLAWTGPASAQEPRDASATPRASTSRSLDGMGYLRELQRRVVRDRIRGQNGRLRLGALSDGFFDVQIAFRKARVMIVMPPFRAKELPRTRRLVRKRYGNVPIQVRLARVYKPDRLTSPAIPPRAGKPLLCPVRLPRSTSGPWNAKRIVGKPLRRAERMARTKGCSVRVVAIDGMGISGHADLEHSRINVVVRSGRITRILGLG